MQYVGQRYTVPFFNVLEIDFFKQIGKILIFVLIPVQSKQIRHSAVHAVFIIGIHLILTTGLIELAER